MSREGVSTWVSELEGTTQITMHNLEHYIIHVIGVLRGGGGARGPYLSDKHR